MYDFMLTPQERELKKEARRFVQDEITTDYLRQMDADAITYPRDFVEKAAARGLLGIRFTKKYGGRDMKRFVVGAEGADFRILERGYELVE